jgi:hypothetical protein
MIFLYILWRRADSMRTVIVLSALEDVTMPCRVRGRPGPCSFAGAWSAGPFSPVEPAAFAFSRRRRRPSALRRRRASRSSVFFWIVS